MNITGVPEPALIRSVLVAATGLIAFTLGHQIDISWIDGVLTMYGLLAPIIAGVVIRPAVVPFVKAGGGAHRSPAADD